MKGLADIKQEIKNSFEAMFKAGSVSRPLLDGVKFNQLSEGDRDGLEEELSYEEIRSTIWKSDGERCTGPNDYDFSFLKK